MESAVGDWPLEYDDDVGDDDDDLDMSAKISKINDSLYCLLLVSCNTEPISSIIYY